MAAIVSAICDSDRARRPRGRCSGPDRARPPYGRGDPQFREGLAGEHDQGQSLLAGLLEQAEALDEPRALLGRRRSASTAWAPAAALPYASRAVEAARAQGLLSLLPVALRSSSGWSS